MRAAGKRPAEAQILPWRQGNARVTRRSGLPTLRATKGFAGQVLNRLFIAIGVLVILAIGAAFIVPRFIQWGDYRGRLETMAAEAFGTKVAIDGDIHLTLLPAPKLEFTRVRVGPASTPVLQVEQVDAEFSLLDFLRDQYKVTSLTLNHPVVDLAIAADGSISSGIAIAGQGQSNVSIANANVESGSVRLTDMRSGAVYAADGINGQLKLDALQGPFSFSGNASVDQAVQGDAALCVRAHRERADGGRGKKSFFHGLSSSNVTRIAEFA